ncbi:hypothetical protein [Streptomyces ipomoeae]|uniref:hypothetical protein n=1 Tax=Streptomyces ipomoeae TaxID=103232 RepID=UPI00299FDCB5|nr:hypothetical protein [Streptomyces ipomoeae]MDX2698953.1 hypothetical protein [Streptomyces ipomoeae]MDX2844925.1 hypothetical protein [Streptomyces ipomoeae]
MSDRLTVDTITGDQLDALYDDRDRVGYEVQQWKATYGEHALRDTLARLNRAEAAVERVRALDEQWVQAGPPPLGASMARWWDARLAELRAALDETKEQPAAPCQQHPRAPVIGGICGGCTQYPNDMPRP